MKFLFFFCAIIMKKRKIFPSLKGVSLCGHFTKKINKPFMILSCCLRRCSAAVCSFAIFSDFPAIPHRVLLSLLFNPLADRLQKFHIPRGISAIIGILLLFALLGLLGFWSGTGLIAKLKELSENLPQYISLFETGLAHFWTRFDTLAQRLPKTLQVFFSSLQTDSSGLSALPCSQGQRNRQAWRCFRLFHCVFCITDFRLFLHKGQRPASPAV